MRTDRLDQQALDAAKPEWIPLVRFLRRTGSTNEDALVWAAGGAPEGSLVVADYQTAGKGRLGRSWFSPPGESLLFTLVLRPRIDASRLALVNLAAAVAVCEALSELGPKAAIKWPNDVLVGGRKIAGVLSEHQGDAVCLGVGVNVGEEDFPPDLALAGTSLYLETGQRFGRLDLLLRFLERFDLLYKDELTAVPESFRRWCSTLGERVRINFLEGSLEATAVDIDPTGALILDTGEVISTGDVVHLRQGGG